MDHDFVLTPDESLRIIVGLLYLGLAGLLLYSRFDNRANRALSLYLVIEGIADILRGMSEGSNYWTRAGTYFSLGIPFALLVFGLEYRRRPTGDRIAGVGVGLVLLLWITIEALFILDHAFFSTSRVAGALPPYELGPLTLVSPPGRSAVSLLIAYFLVGDYVRSTPSRRSSSVILIATSLCVFPLTFAVFHLVGGDVLQILRFPGTYEAITHYAQDAFIAPLILIGWRLHRHAKQAIDPAVKRIWRRVVFASGLLVGFVSVLAMTVFLGTLSLSEVGNIGIGVADASVPFFLGYALLRHQLFDIDLKVKWGISRGTLAAVFVAVFFVVAQITQTYLTGEYGLLLGGISAGLLLFALAPLQRFAERVANAAMPGVQPPTAILAAEKVAVFRTAVEMALSDGIITRAEERALAKLASQLGIDAHTAFELREEVERGPRPGSSG